MNEYVNPEGWQQVAAPPNPVRLLLWASDGGATMLCLSDDGRRFSRELTGQCKLAGRTWLEAAGGHDSGRAQICEFGGLPASACHVVCEEVS